MVFYLGTSIGSILPFLISIIVILVVFIYLYKQNPQAGKDRILQTINADKEKTFNEWWNYLTEENEIYKEL